MRAERRGAGEEEEDSEEGGTWQWGDTERKTCLSLSPSHPHGPRSVPRTAASGSFTGIGCSVLYCRCGERERERERAREADGCSEEVADRLLSRISVFIYSIISSVCVFVCVCVCVYSLVRLS